MKIAMVTAVAAMLALAGCGGSGDDHETTGTTPAAPQAGPEAPPMPPQAGPEAPPMPPQAGPKAPPTPPQASGDVADPEGAAMTAAVAEYVDTLNRHDAAGACALFAPGALDLDELPRRGGGCEASLGASIGVRPPHGAPAWQRTRLLQARTTALDENRARVTATVTHRFSDRNYVSVEDDVIYLERIGDRWLLAKPSATFFRAVGYPEPPLRALSPPAGW